MSKQIVSALWHWKVEDNLDWGFCAGILKQDEGIEMSPAEIKNIFTGYFKQTTGIAPYTKCPECGELLLPRESQYGYFVGCSTYPNCRFMASESKPYTKAKGDKQNG